MPTGIYIRTKAQIDNMSIAQKKRWLNEEYRNKMSRILKGKPRVILSDDMIKKRNEYNKEYQHKYSVLHKEEKVRCDKKYQQIHKEEIKERSRNYYLAHKDEILTKGKTEDARNHHREVAQLRRMKVLEHYGGSPPKCVVCGFNDIHALCIDHINGGGTQQSKQYHSMGNYIVSWLINNRFPRGFQILCANCNMIKWREKELKYGKEYNQYIQSLVIKKQNDNISV